MKLWALMANIVIESDGANEKATLEVETPVISILYGHRHEGKLLKFTGIVGRVSDIPAYLGGEDVIRYEHRDDCHYITI